MGLTLRSSLSTVALLIVIGLTCCWLVSPSLATGGAKNSVSFAEQCTEEERLLKEKLAENALWADAQRKEELLGCIASVTAIRARSVATILAARIEYDPDPGAIGDRERPLGVRYPVYGALSSIGIPSVPCILAELKKRDPKDEADTSRVKRRLLEFCIRDIYEQGVSQAMKAQPAWQQGEHGRAMGRKRLELELAAAKDEKEKANLQIALGHAAFKEIAPDAGRNKK